jgi:hypothetical protein
MRLLCACARWSDFNTKIVPGGIAPLVVATCVYTCHTSRSNHAIPRSLPCYPILAGGGRVKMDTWKNDCGLMLCPRRYLVLNRTSLGGVIRFICYFLTYAVFCVSVPYLPRPNSRRERFLAQSSVSNVCVFPLRGYCVLFCLWSLPMDAGGGICASGESRLKIW